MSYTFDGANKLIILSLGTTILNVADLYSRYKEWVLAGNSQYYLGMTSLGGDTLPGGRFMGSIVFLENGWKIKPAEENHTLIVSGNLYSRDNSDPFVSTTGNFNVRIMLTVSNIIDTISTTNGIGTVQEVKDAVWSATLSGYPNGAGKVVSDINSNLNTLDTKVNNIPTNVKSAFANELIHLMALQNGLTTLQATRLFEIYKLYGLDVNSPLVVKNTSRQAGDISQRIETGTDSTTVTRI